VSTVAKNTVLNSFISADGSPTLQPVGGEKMHAEAGAYSESQYVYGEAIRTALKQSHELSVLSVGFGLGYLEMIAIAEAKKHSCPLRILSFENEPQLVQGFEAWLDGSSTLPFERVSEIVSRDYKIDRSQFKKLQKTYYRDSWQLEKDIESLPNSGQKFNCLLYDAYSSKTTPQLWQADFLLRFLEKYADKKSVFATYASTSVLKKVLKSQGFTVLKKHGFDKKRECTLALRESF
jgi:tRNA U34 5-methylaminomethyl-2-thiouridine-forming methyltransferase MnmC